jgi:hypothetical protein
LGSGDDEQTARVAIEAVHDAGTVRVAHGRDVGEPGEQSVHQRAVRMPCTRVHHESRGLRHDDHVVVGVPDVDLDGRVGFGRRAHGGLLEHFDHGALDQLVALAHRAAVDHDRATRPTAPARRRDSTR